MKEETLFEDIFNSIPLFSRPKVLRLSMEVYSSLLDDPRNRPILTPLLASETLFGIKYRIDETLKPGEWKID